MMLLISTSTSASWLAGVAPESGRRLLDGRRWRHSPCAQMGLFDSLAAAFENDDSLGERSEAGLKNKVVYQTITFVGPKPENFWEQQAVTEAQAVGGQKLKDVAQSAGIPIKYACMEGTCRICDVVVDGERVPACIAKCPKRDVTIEYRGVKTKKVTQGRVQPSGLAASFGAAVTAAGEAGPAAAKAASEPQAAQAADQDETAPPALSLEERLAAQLLSENAAAAKKKGGWPFG